MTDDQLISELARLDAAATPGPAQNADGSGNPKPTKLLTGKPGDDMIPAFLADFIDPTPRRGTAEANAKFAAFMFTHRARLLDLLRRAKRGEELLILAGGVLHPATHSGQTDEEKDAFSKIDAFLREGADGNEEPHAD